MDVEKETKYLAQSYAAIYTLDGAASLLRGLPGSQHNGYTAKLITALDKERNRALERYEHEVAKMQFAIRSKQGVV